MNTSWKAIAVAAALAAAPLCVRAQSADLNTAAPTKNDFRLRVVEPAEGATLAGPTVRVTVSNALPDARGRTGSELSNTAPVPRPDITVSLDGRDQGTLRDTQNVLTLENVPTGSHKLVVLARNKSGEIVDRREVTFKVAPESEPAAGTTGATSAAPEPSAANPQPPSGEAAAAPESSAPLSRPAPAPDRPEASRAPAPETAPATLPKTGTSVPAIALGGAALLAAGLWLRRRA